MADSMTAREALKEFYRTHYFGDEASSWSVIKVSLGPMSFPFPNLKQRREAIYLHDLTHLLTGYDTSWTGEGEVAAWELASGFTRKYWVGWIYPPLTLAIGLCISPRRVFRAFCRGWRRPNLYKLDLRREVIELKTISELKALIELK